MEKKSAALQKKEPNGKIPLWRRISFKLTIPVTSGVLLVSIATIVLMAVSSLNVLNDLNTERSEQALITMSAFLEDYEASSKKAAETLAGTESIVSQMEAGDAESIRNAVKQTISQLGLDVDFVTLTDPAGNVLARTHSDRTGDSVTNQKNIAAALTGAVTTHTDLGSEIKLSIRSGAPIRDQNGTLLGALSTGYSLVEPAFVDRLKSMTGNEFTLFIGDERVNTTIMDNGQRVIGTKLDAQIAETVLQGKNEYHGTADILGVPYATAYQPIIDSDGEAIGVFFAGISLATVNAATQSAILSSVALVLVIAVVVLACLVLLVRKQILNPLSEMSQVAAELAQGNLHLTLKHQSTDELGVLANALRTTVGSLQGYIEDISSQLGQMSRGDMRVRIGLDYVGDFAPIKTALFRIASALNDTLSLIRTSADQVSIGSGQVASAAQALASGASEQAATVEELSASVTMVAQDAEENAESARQATVYVKETSSGVDAGNTHMQHLTAAMEDIRESSEKIASITKAVEDIAFQTNILALNAAIEAARAGAAGKGFAVVADEVRNLAAKSAEAAKQTGELIQHSVVTVAEGNRLAAETADILRTVAEKAEYVSTAVQGIEVASSQQASAIDQIMQGLEQVSTVVQTNAATAEESSASSEELAAQAQMLQEEVAKFELDQEQGYRKAPERSQYLPEASAEYDPVPTAAGDKY